MATFKARARAVDMLGRQQIAGIPTAISELFKNAHDAYADVAEVDYLRYASTLIIRDDGLGMARSDFEERWLVLGTESKVVPVGRALSDAPYDPGKPRRAILGEKGIGRLAIAAIGPQVLILTRPKYPSGSDLSAAFIHWDMFSIPGVNLDELQVPIATFGWGVLPGATDVANLVAQARTGLELLGSRVPESLAEKIRRDLDAFRIDPIAIADQLGDPSLREAHGTHFYITPVDESLSGTLAARGDDTASPLVKMLIGFSNTMTPSHGPRVMRTAFRDHEDEFGNFSDPIAENEFFTPEEFGHADHNLKGVFDEFGQFRGQITIYGQRTENYTIPFNAMGLKTQCGPFSINVAVVQGVERDSMLPAERWASLYAKLNKIGGLYIYRDGIRVLPYGNNDYDFIDMEKRRTLSARYYYFSYRRIFGVIDIDSIRNRELVEKAGREGFRENVAYRQFRDILENFFVNVAANFFREGGERSEVFAQKRAELDRVEQARRKRDKLASQRRAQFETELETKFAALNAEEPQREAACIISDLGEALKRYQSSADEEYAQRGFINAQSEALRRVSALRGHYKAARPRGVGIPKRLRRDLDAYNAALSDMIDSVIVPTERRVESLLLDAAQGALIAIDRRLRFHRAIEEAVQSARQRVDEAASESGRATLQLRSTVAEISRAARATVDDTGNECLAEASSTDVASLSEGEFVDQRLRIESKIDEESERLEALLVEIAAQVNSLSWDRDETGEVVSGLDVSEAVGDEILELRERLDADLELSQLGMAVKIINHEFESTIRSVRSSLRKLRAWSDANESIRPIYDNISTNFEHLDGYLRLFTPLQRRLYRNQVQIKGSDIGKFVGDLFEERLSRDGAKVIETRSFRAAKFVGFPSTYYPVFVNLIDNALHWVELSGAERVITLDALGDAFLVSNSGPQISIADRERIFEQGFSRKVGGRGLGLFISREVLRAVGGDLIVAEPPSGFGAAFKIVLPEAAGFGPLDGQSES